MLGLRGAEAVEFGANTSSIIEEFRQDGQVAERLKAIEELYGRGDELIGRLMSFESGGESGFIPGMWRESRVAKMDLNVEHFTVLASDLLMAGREQLVNQFSNLLLLTALHPHVYATLTSGEADVAPVVDEAIRRLPALSGVPRRVIERIELAGRVFEEGDYVGLSIVAANLDSSVFERPLLFLPGRDVPHVGFGGGEHKCIGGRLAQRVMAVGLECLARCVHTLSVTDFKWRPSVIQRGLSRLEVTVEWSQF